MAGRTKKEKETANDLTLEEAFDALEETVGRLESEELSLEEAFGAYERGMRLVKLCNEKIDRVEKRVRVLNAQGEIDDFQGDDV